MPPLPPVRSPVVRYKVALASRFFLRFHMGLMYTAASVVGVGASKAMLNGGVLTPMVRYPLAVLVSYAAFVGMLRLWIFYVRHASEGDTATVLDAGIDAADAGFSWAPSWSGRGGGGAGFDLDLGDDAFWVVAALMALVAVIAGCGGYLIYIAPDFLPELAVSAALGVSIERAAKRAESQGWLVSALRATAIPFAVVLVLAVVLGYAVQAVCPGAVRLMEAMNCPVP
ncbi:MAG: hypothetical protein IT162_08205 [Bryobacterales bacterium]|nr:hypothetical protein [Bryobacterales bacterium]